MKEYLQLFWAFIKVGGLTFGGGYAMLPILQRDIVEKYGWATEEEVMDYYAMAQCLPGIIMINTSAFIGQHRKGTLGGFGVILEGLPEKLAEEYCPGPITIIAPRTDGTTVGFRIPDHPLVLEILRRIDVPLASTSANLSGRPNALTVGEALAELTGEVDLAIDAGAIPADAQPSTVVLATGKEPKVLRPGPIRFQ